MTRLVRVAALIGAGLAGSSSPARADILVTPFVGKTFAAQTPLLLAEGLDTQKWVVGGSAGWLGAGVLGVELDLGYAPRFFHSDRGFGLTDPGSNATTFTGNAIVTLPLSVTRESLRPYLSVGLGLLHTGASDLAETVATDRNLLAVSVGGGVIGFVTARTGVRFDLRRISSVASGVDTLTGATEPRLSFWRATFGVALRY